MISGPALGSLLLVFIFRYALPGCPSIYMPDVGNGYEALDSEKPLAADGGDPKHVAFSCAVRAARTHFFRASATGLLDEARAEGSQ